jgi:hypothetical protein
MGPTSLSTYYKYIMTNLQKGIWSFYNNQHDQSTMGIDPMNNISKNNKNTLCSYIILTLVTFRINAEEFCNNKTNLFCFFVDFRKDFDMIPTLWLMVIGQVR